MKRYTLHQELDDGTFDSTPFLATNNKRSALRIAKIVAKTTQPGIIRRIIVSKDDMTVAAYPATGA